MARIASNGGGWDWVDRLPDAIDPRDLVADRDDHLPLAGDKGTGAATTFPLEGGGSAVLPPTAGAFMAELRDIGSSGAWQWAKSTVGGEGRRLRRSRRRRLHHRPLQRHLSARQRLAGPFRGRQRSTFTSPASTATAIFSPVTPRAAGATAAARCKRAAPAPTRPIPSPATCFGQLYAGGRFAGIASFGSGDNGVVTALSGNDAVIAKLDAIGRWAEQASGALMVGEPMKAPAGAELTQAAFIPDFLLAGAPFNALESYFHGACRRPTGESPS